VKRIGRKWRKNGAIKFKKYKTRRPF